jgi:hypothetical protein
MLYSDHGREDFIKDICRLTDQTIAIQNEIEHNLMAHTVSFEAYEDEIIKNANELAG